MGVTGVREQDFPPMALLHTAAGLGYEGGVGTPGKRLQVQQEGLKLESKKDLHTSSSALSKGRLPISLLNHALSEWM